MSELREIRDKIFDIHGVVCATQERLNTHISHCEETNKHQSSQIREVDTRIKVLERIVDRVKIFRWPIGIVAAAVVTTLVKTWMG